MRRIAVVSDEMMSGLRMRQMVIRGDSVVESGLVKCSLTREPCRILSRVIAMNGMRWLACMSKVMVVQVEGNVRHGGWWIVAGKRAPVC